MAWRAKVGRHVHYVTATGRLRTARVTAVTDQNNMTVKTYRGTPALKTRHFSVSVNGSRSDKIRATA